MEEKNPDVSKPIKSKSKPWVLPALILWALSPAILIAISILGGWEYDWAQPFWRLAPPSSFFFDSSIGAGALILIVGVLGMPFILYPWSIVFLKWQGKKTPTAWLLGIPLAAIMCIVDLTLGLGGCSLLSHIVPPKGLF